jgi:hypothetical protein
LHVLHLSVRLSASQVFQEYHSLILLVVQLGSTIPYGDELHTRGPLDTVPAQSHNTLPNTVSFC